jgi:glycosyltransferase involved in cell wall biosynthesis
MSDQLISCLLVTLPVPERFSMLVRSIDGFRQQTHADRELVLVLNGGDGGAAQRIRDHVAALADPAIRVVEPPGVLPLGTLRNASIAAARGGIVCQWDDDDIYHPERLARQLAALGDADAVFLREVMQFYPHERTIYCTNWQATENKAFPGSLMCRVSTGIIYPETGEEARLGEDSVVARTLAGTCRVEMLAGAPHLYVYVSHGRNSWPDEHHRMLAGSLALSRGLLLRREAELRAGMAPIDLGPDEVVVHGYNGAAFSLPSPTLTAMSSLKAASPEAMS